MGEGFIVRKGISLGVVKYFLYKNGNEYNALTGGWTVRNNTGGASEKEASDFLVKLTAGTTAYIGTWIYTNSKIDLTQYKTLNIRIANNATNIILCVDDLQYNTGFANYLAKTSITTVTNGVLSLDISAMNASYYVSFVAYLTTGQGIVSEVWLE